MPALHERLRKQLEKTVIAARDIAEDAAREALKRLAVDQSKLFGHMTPDERELRNKLRAKARQLGDRRDKAGAQTIDHLVTECAYEHWHRMLFARFLAENHLLIHEKEGVDVTLDDCEELAKEEGTDGWTLAARFASRMLPQIFRPDDPALAVTLAPESKRALEKQLDTLPPDVFTADDSLGWVYQFWQDKRKDEINASGVKIGADELPAVTQLFTEHYMVLFLLHNTLGAWWAGKVLQSRDREVADKEELSEDEWRKRVALPGCDFDYLRFLPGGTPAAGTFSGWPTEAKDLKILDPCCGSGHFLVASFDLMVRIRMEEEGLAPRDACDAVLRDNIFGLEIDQRCTQIAAFALALSSWRFPETGGYRELPELHIACSGIGPHATEEQWLKLAEQSGVPMPALGKQPIREGLCNLHALFSQAPTLGSLIDSSELPGDLIAADYETLQPYLTAALKVEHADDEAHERAVAAAGMVKAAELLASQYTLVITNVPYLTSQKQCEELKRFCGSFFPDAKADLAAVFVDRCLRSCQGWGTVALVTPQLWLFLKSYMKLRSRLLRTATWHFIARLGPGAFETISGEVVNVALLTISNHAASAGHTLRGLDCTNLRSVTEKACGLQTTEIESDDQSAILQTPDSRIVIGLERGTATLGDFSLAPRGLATGDDNRHVRAFWEMDSIPPDWTRFLQPPEESGRIGGRSTVICWEDASGHMRDNAGARIQGQAAWDKAGVLVSLIGPFPITPSFGELHAQSTAVLVAKNPEHLSALWAFCLSPKFSEEVRRLDSKVLTTPATLTKVPFDQIHWQRAARDQLPPPEPVSNDPTQYLFKGRLAASRRPLEVAAVRLLGYRWPEQVADATDELVDDDGVVCIPAVRGERTAADRVRTVLSVSYGSDWSPAKQEELLASVGYGGKSLGDWLRNGFFEQHCKLFRQRPFIWHVWDGRKQDGFGALVNYHRLDAKLLDRLIYTYLGDWIKRQEQDVAQEESGADARLLAAQQLQEKLKLIAEGEPPYDVFVRWKPIEKQAIGWNPDLNDGVRMNIRPFMEANILRKKPNIKWKKDRGKEPERPHEQYPWFYDQNGEPTGDRVNDVHLTNAQKQAAREKVGVA